MKSGGCSHHPSLGSLAKLLQRARARCWRHRVLEACFGWGLPWGATLGLLGAYFLGLTWGALGALPVVFAVVRVRAPGLLEVARRIDGAAGTYDLLAHSWELAGKQDRGSREGVGTTTTTTTTTAHILGQLFTQAEARAEAIDIVEVLPRPSWSGWRTGAKAAMVAGAVTCFVHAGMGWLVGDRDENATTDSAGAALASPRLTERQVSEEPSVVVPETLLAALRVRLADHQAGLDQASATEREIYGELMELVAALEKGAMKSGELGQRLAEIEKKLAAWAQRKGGMSREDLDYSEGALRALSESLRHEREGRALAAAIEARDERRLARALAQERGNARARGAALARGAEALERRLARNDADSADGQGPTASTEEGVQRLRRHSANANSESTNGSAAQTSKERRLQRKQHRAERPGTSPGRSAGGASTGARERIQRLARLTQEAADHNKRAAQGRKGAEGSGARRQAEQALGQALREEVKRNARGARMRSSKQAVGDLRRWAQRGQDSNNEKQLQRFAVRAGGKSGAGKPGAEAGKQSGKQAGKQAGAETRTVSETTRRITVASSGQAPGHGSTAPHQRTGDKRQTNQRRVATKDIQVGAKEGTGVSRARVIERADQSGFTTADYHAVYRDYHSFSQSPRESRRVPPRRRAAVRDYFNLIAPRD